jgi:hypothetical protein
MTRDRDPWRAHEREQLRAWRTLSPAQRLAWLWQAKLFARRALEAKTARDKKPR